MIAEIPHKLDSKTQGNEYISDYFSLRRKSKSKEVLVFDINQFENFDLYNFEKVNHVNYNYKNQFNIDIPIEIFYLNDVIKKSEYILELENDWDENGSEKYNFDTWKNSIIFLIDYSKILLTDFNKKIAIPNIYHGPKGSIDILWEEANYKLLINVNKNGTNAVFYGSNNDYSNNIKGEFSLNNFSKTLIPIAFNL